MKKFLMILTALVLTMSLLAGCSGSGESGTAEPETSSEVTSSEAESSKEDSNLEALFDDEESSKEEESVVEEDDSVLYKYDVTVYIWDFETYFAAGEQPVIDLTNSHFPGRTLVVDASEITFSKYDQYLDDEHSRVILEREFKVDDPSVAHMQDPEAWTAEAQYDFQVTVEVTEPVTEGDYETHGAMSVSLIQVDYVWDIEVVFDGTSGSYRFLNPGLDGWEMRGDYRDQTFDVSPENPTAELKIFNCSDWIVDNTRDWYKWVVFDQTNEGGNITYEIIRPLQELDRTVHGQLKITISK